MTKYTEEEFANLTDEEILNMAEAPEIEPTVSEDPVDDDSNAVEEVTPDDEDPEGQDDNESEEGEDDASPADDEDPEDSAEEVEEEASEEDEEPAEDSDTDTPDEKTDATAAEPDKKTKKTDKVDKAEEPAIDYEAAYKQIMAPFKANGKEIKLENPQEAVRLMQMGANYTKKLQALQPHLKVVKMLENNQLLDEGKLSYLIDLSKKEPAAVQKLVRESGLDPLDIDTSEEPNYVPGNHSISDEEMAFNTVLEDVASDPTGKETIKLIHTEWDDASKQELWKEPELLRSIAAQRSNGIYDRIVGEMEKRRMLGTLPTGKFIQAYHDIGKEMQATGRFDDLAPGDTPQPGKKVLERRSAQQKKKVTNNDKVRAAAPARSAPKRVKQEFNPLALSDEDFEKNAELARKL